MAVVVAPLDHEATWLAAHDGVNAWRGACMQCFAHAEAAVTETLLVLHGVEGRGRTVRLRHLVGQRLADLAAAIDPNGPFEAEGKSASMALEQFREHEDLRNLLGHGVAKVTLEKRRSWVIIFQHLSIKAQAPGRERRVFEQSEAKSVLEELQRKSRKVCSTLGSLRAHVSGRAATGAGG